MDLSELRREYAQQPHDYESTDEDPYVQFQDWFSQAQKAELDEPNAMVLATVNAQGRPSQRTVLLKFFDESGFVFFTNYGSRKAQQIEQNQQVAALFQWLPLSRQIEINGTAEKITKAESLKYFMKRPRGSQLGAWVSQQSQIVSSRRLIEAKLAEVTKRFAGGSVPLPSFWGGFRIRPHRFEFWQGGPNRLHDRIEYEPDANEPGKWSRRRLSP